jgi:hypothetical protein
MQQSLGGTHAPSQLHLPHPTRNPRPIPVAYTRSLRTRVTLVCSIVRNRYNILHEYKLHNAHIVIRQDVSIDEFIDVIEGNRKYIRCLYVYNKVRSVYPGGGGGL